MTAARVALIVLLALGPSAAITQSDDSIPRDRLARPLPPPFDDVLKEDPAKQVWARIEFVRIVRSRELIAALGGFALQPIAFHNKHVGSGGGGTNVFPGISAADHLPLYEEFHRLNSLWKLKEERCGRERAGARPFFSPPMVFPGGRFIEGSVTEAPTRGPRAVLGHAPLISESSVPCEVSEDDLPECPVDDATAPVKDTHGVPGDPEIEAVCGLRLNRMDVTGTAEEMDRFRQDADFVGSVQLLPEPLVPSQRTSEPE